MQTLVDVVGYLNSVAFPLLALAAFVVWRRRRSRASLWAALTFGSLGVVQILGTLVPADAEEAGRQLLVRINVSLLLVFPYLLYRFTTAFRTAPRRLDRALGLVTAALLVWTFALPEIPREGEPQTAAFTVYVVAFVVHWSVLAILAAVRLWRAGQGQPRIARRRMRLLAIASATITAALVLAALASLGAGARLVGGLLGFVSAVAFAVGLAPPATLRALWRMPEQERVQAAIQSLVAASRREEVAERVLGPMTDLVGAQAVAIRDANGDIVGMHGAPDGGRDETVLELEVQGGSIVVWTTPYAPFFGDEELRLLRTLGALVGLALDRVRLFEQEHEARLALERADELKSEFVALAAHELRTPVAAIHGFVQTLDRLGEADEGTRATLFAELVRQSDRLVVLVEQLLDLSRLDADVIAIEPRRLHVRDHLESLVATAAGSRRSDVRVEAPAELVAELDPEAVDRIVTNLVGNALRHGRPPVVVTAEAQGPTIRLSVEDRGRGVPPEFAPKLFERFSRSSESGVRVSGTGLGLAIARSYARAHGGDLVYAGAGHGARFDLVLPVTPAAPRAEVGATAGATARPREAPAT